MKRKSFIVVGLGYGDEGKGSWVDYLCRIEPIDFVVRFNGGAQAAHHVLTSEGVSHCFSQLGSGSFSSGVKTLLSRYMLVEPFALLYEAETLRKKGVFDILDRIYVDENCPIITPFNSLLNKIQESSRGNSRHGSCGRGIGLTQEDVEVLGERALYVKDLADEKRCLWKSRLLWEQKLELAESIVADDDRSQKLMWKLRNLDLKAIVSEYQRFFRAVKILRTDEVLHLLRSNNLVFEGAQGILLDQLYGFFPHVTRSNTGFVNAESLLNEAGFTGDLFKIGLLRGYSTRHGAGPFISEDVLPVSPCDNQTNTWQGVFRLGWFDVVTARYALRAVGGVDVLAITNLDRMEGLNEIKICSSYHPPSDFFTSEGDLVLPKFFDRIKLTERTQWIRDCYPVNVSFLEGKKSEGWIEEYLRVIALLIDRDVDAFSTSPTFEGKSLFQRDTSLNSI